MQYLNSLPQLDTLRPGDHLCCIYETEEEHRQVITPFLIKGLKQHEKILYIVDIHSAESILKYLRKEGINVHYYLNCEQLVILSGHESYVQQGAFDPDKMITLLKSETEKAIAQGYNALRVTGEMTWALRGLPGSERLIEYEIKLNEFLPGSSCLAICQYNRWQFDSSLLVEILRTHPIAIIGTEVYHNFYYIPPEDLLSKDAETKKFKQWINNLAQKKEMETSLLKKTHQLGERVKELNCIYEILNLGMRQDLDLDQIMHKAVMLIPPSWQYSEITCARIILDGQEYRTDNFLKTPWKQDCEISIFGESRGTLEIYYLEETPTSNAGPFLREERNLIQAIAKQIGQIVEFRLTEKYLHQEKENARRYLDIAGVIILVLNKKEEITLINQKGCQILGYNSEDIIGKKWFDNFLPKHINEQVKEVFHKILAGDISPVEYFENPILTKHGQERIIAWHNTFLKDDAGNITGSLSSGEDITERKIMEEKNKHLNQILRAVRNVNQLIVHQKDREKLVQEACHNLTETRGYTGAWIALFDQENRLINSAQSGLGDQFTSLQNDLTQGKLNTCTRRALKRPGVVIIEQPEKHCGDCTMVQPAENVMTIRLEHGNKIYGVLSVFISREFVADKEEQTLFEEVAEDLGFALHSIEVEEEEKRKGEELRKSQEDLKQTLSKLDQAMQGTIQALSKALEEKDPYTSGHQKRVTNLACTIAKEMGLDEDRIQGLYLAGMVHDIGKISIPLDFLTKPTKLTALQFSIIKNHVQIGYDLLKDIEFPWPVADIVLHHHERIDGSGYPQGLTGKDMLLEGKILAVADVVEAMASHRPYRPALGLNTALEQVDNNKGILYDPKVVKACLRVFKEQNFDFD